MNAVEVPAWGGEDLAELLTLEPLEPQSPTRFRNRCGDRNAHDRTYGGQVLAQALMAAAHDVPAGRAATMMQFLFLQGALHREAIQFDVTALQDGKRFSSRHVRGSQSGGRLIFDAQVSFAVPLAAPAHAAPIEPLALLETPENLPRLSDLPAAWGTEVTRALGYGLIDKPVVDFRLSIVPDALDRPNALCLSLPEPRLRFWLKASRALPDAPMLHAGVFAYLSDWWLNYASVGGHLQALELAQGLYGVVLANILATPLKLLAPLLAGHVAPGGWLVMAGILERQADALKAAYAPWLDVQVAELEEGWILMCAQRRAA